MADGRVVVPESRAMATEPALTIAGVFADKAMIKTYVSAALGVLALTTGWVADDDTIENVSQLVGLLGLIFASIMAEVEKRSIAKQQGAATREAVYAPATVEAIANRQYAAGMPPTEAQPDIPPPGEVNEAGPV
jgi:hypothetical protein